jgi:hypothetical protein
MAAPGLSFVVSMVKYGNSISDSAYNDFYNNEHIPDLINFFKDKGHINNPLALRYKNINPTTDKPYLALYPNPDAQWIFSPDQGKLQESSKRSHTLGVDNIFDHIDSTFRAYTKIQTFEGYNHASKSGHDRGKTLVCVAMEPHNSESGEQDFEGWYRKQHLDMPSMCKGHRRTTRYK